MVDGECVLSPNMDKKLTIEVTGNGELVAVDNGARDSHESFISNQRRTARGQAIAIVRATADEGSFQLNVTGDGLVPASVEIAIGQ
jgi:beta-galactosidase